MKEHLHRQIESMLKKNSHLGGRMITINGVEMRVDGCKVHIRHKALIEFDEPPTNQQLIEVAQNFNSKKKKKK